MNSAIQKLIGFITSMGLGKYINLGLILATLVAGGLGYVYVTRNIAEIKTLTEDNVDLRVQVSNLNKTLADLKATAVLKDQTLTAFYDSMIESGVSYEKIGEWMKTAIDDIKNDDDPVKTQTTINALQADMTACLVAASGGPAVTVDNKICPR